MHTLTKRQKHELADLIRCEFGVNQTRPTFPDVVLVRFEDIAGFETMPQKTLLQFPKLR